MAYHGLLFNIDDYHTDHTIQICIVFITNLRLHWLVFPNVHNIYLKYMLFFCYYISVLFWKEMNLFVKQNLWRSVSMCIIYKCICVYVFKMDSS